MHNKKQQPNDSFLVYESKISEESQFFIYKLSDSEFELWDVPQYGGVPCYCDTFDNYAAALDMGNSFT